MSCERLSEHLPVKRTNRTGEKRLDVVKAIAVSDFLSKKWGEEVGVESEEYSREVVPADAGWYLFSPHIQSVRNISKKKKKRDTSNVSKHILIF